MTDDLVPACGGAEPVTIVNGRRWQYCFHPASGRHCYLDVDNDLATWHRSFHPAFAPEFELQDDQAAPVEARAQESVVEEPMLAPLYF